MDAPGRHNFSYSALQKGALGLAICVRFSNFFAYEMRRVGGHIHEDYSILLERDIEIRHKIDMVCGNTKGNENCTYTFVVGRSTQNFMVSLLRKTKQRKRRNIKEMTSANNFRALFGKARPKLPLILTFYSRPSHDTESMVV